MKRLAMLAFSVALAAPAMAQVNRCIIDGQMTWQSAPCPEQEEPGDAIHPNPAYDLAYRLAQGIERTYLSFQRCRREEAGGCSQFSERYLNELGPLLVETENNLQAIASNPSAAALLRRHIDDLNEMTQLMQAAQGLQQRLLTLPPP